MILTDVNVLVYAFRKEADHHERYAEWLHGVVSGDEELALHDLPLTGFVRIATNPRIFADPAPTTTALDFVDRLLTARRSRWLPGGPLGWKHLRELSVHDRALRANLMPDAVLAALAIVNRCRLATADRGVARFPGLDWFDPAA